MKDPKPIQRWQANFYTGLAIVLPVVISIAIVKWLFGTVANITDLLLFFLKWLPIDKRWIYANGVDGQMLLHWSLLALALAVGLITLIGRFARHFIGLKAIQLMDWVMLNVPLLNKIYSAIKQVNEAFTSSKKSSFKHVVIVDFPGDGIYSVAFITGDDHPEVTERMGQRMVSVFVPTTPNPTSGFLVLLPEHKVRKLDMSVADGIKFIVSLGTVAPEYHARAVAKLAAETEPDAVAAK